MSRQNTALRCVLGNKIEVKLLVWVFIFNNLFINYTSRWWIYKPIIIIINKESLIDSFIHNYDSNVGLLARFVILLENGFFKLWYFLLDYLLSHRISDTISEKYQMFRELIIVILSKWIKCLFKNVFKLPINYFLTSSLVYFLRVVMTHFFVYWCTEANYWVLTCVADINS